MEFGPATAAGAPLKTLLQACPSHYIVFRDSGRKQSPFIRELFL